ncbi:MAG: hypothetical protein PHE56_13860 [Bacteroidales bacterium]|nr:hypothetical protein [Bacteroidales bacterium]
MNKLILLAIFISISTVLSAQVMKGQYGFKSGHVEYELTGNTTGTKTLWWDNYGAQSYTETNSVTVIEMFGVKNETKIHTISVIDGDNYWFADLNSKTGQEGSISSMLGYEAVSEMTPEEKEQFGEQMIDSLGGERMGTENIKGCNCDVIYLGGAKSWNCKGVILKLQVEVMGANANEDATVFETNISVPASKFVKIPGITYSNNDEYMKLLEQYMEIEEAGGDE